MRAESVRLVVRYISDAAPLRGRFVVQDCLLPAQHGVEVLLGLASLPEHADKQAARSNLCISVGYGYSPRDTALPVVLNPQLVGAAAGKAKAVAFED